MITRRAFAAGSALFLVSATQAGAASPAAHALDHRFAEIEKRSGGRLGIAALDTETGARFAHRRNERFPLCSTFKLLAAGAILTRIDQGKEQLNRRIPITAGDVLDYAPIAKTHVGGDMSVAELCAAALNYSDNTAANLLLAALGGPSAVTAYARALGDRVTRLDRSEPTLNEAKPRDPRDTTSPEAMLADMRALLLGAALSAASRDQLTQWLLGNKTGDHRLRAGLPPNWRIGDKTGSGGHGSTNDIAIIWPPHRKPLLLAVYLTQTTVPDAQREATLAAVARAVAAAVTTAG